MTSYHYTKINEVDSQMVVEYELHIIIQSLMKLILKWQ